MKRLAALFVFFFLALIGAQAQAVSQGDVLRVGVNLRGRSTPSFDGSSNIEFGLSIGTKVEVLQVRPFRNGSAGVKVRILSGPKQGETVWVYQNRKGSYLSKVEDVVVKPVDPIATPPLPKPVPTPVPTPADLPYCPPEITGPVPGSEVKNILNVADRLDGPGFKTQASGSEKLRCQPLEAGQSRVVNLKFYDSPTKASAKYRVARISPSEYEVTINPVFRDLRMAREEDEAFQGRFRKRIQACLNFANRAMIGPNGQKLKLAIAPLGTDEAEVPPVEIGVYSAKGGEVTRNSSLKYKEDIDCPTMVHEMMHLLGLCDEYKEEWMGKKVAPDGTILTPEDGSSKYAYDCRAVGPDESIMSDNFKAFSNLLRYGSWKPFIYTCSCINATNNASCRNLLANWDPSTGECPRGARMTGSRIADVHEVDRVTGATALADGAVEFVKASDRLPLRRSLLHPAHFNAIVHPGCAVNEDFYACSRNAYVDAKGPNGEGCSPVPDSCRGGSKGWIGDLIRP